MIPCKSPPKKYFPRDGFSGSSSQCRNEFSGLLYAGNFSFDSDVCGLPTANRSGKIWYVTWSAIQSESVFIFIDSMNCLHPAQSAIPLKTAQKKAINFGFVSQFSPLLTP